MTVAVFSVVNSALTLSNAKIHFIVGLGVTQIVQSILRDQHRVLTVSCLIPGLYGIEDVYLSLPTVVDRQGVGRIVQLTLSPLEEQQLKHSAEVLRQAIDGLKLF